MNLGTFACILCMRQGGRMVEQIEDLRGLSKSSPRMAMAMAVLMFSMAGIPPMAGFFGKYFIFLTAIDAGLYTLAVIGVLTSVVGAFYYIRIVKLMYFEEPTEAFDRQADGSLRLVMGVSSLAVAFFPLIIGPTLDSASRAAAALFAG